MDIKNVLVTGGDGFLGKNVVSVLKETYPGANIIIPVLSEIDLRERQETIEYFEKHKPDVVIALAARLGGIGDNRMYPASYFYDNITIGINTIDASRLSGVQKLVLIGTVCSYPKIVPAPFKEEDLWNGYPEPTNGAYGISKKAVAEYSIAVKKQYGLSCVNILLTNLYGPKDDFRDETSHVIPALIKKIYNAKENGDSEIVAWGDGSPTRDFVYVRDAAEGIVKSINCEDETPINIGSGSEISIKNLFHILCEHLEFDGNVVWDTSKPNGQPRRLLDITKARKKFGFNPTTTFQDGLKNTVKWYIENRLKIDKLAPKHTNNK